MKMPTSKYRGVVRQHSGKWGAQVCKNNQRIWLGSFCTEVEAAEAYDIAAQSLHGRYAITNFKPFSQSDTGSRAALRFLHSHTATEVINMLRNHTYHAEFKRSLHIDLIQQTRQYSAGKMGQEAKATRKFLFHKVVSPGDVGPQNRLLIPRQHALKHFAFSLSGSGATGRGGVMIDFEDMETGKIWRFRYAFWRGARNHVLNGGWADFAREKGIEQGNVISFWRVTDELDVVHLLIACDIPAMVVSSTPEVPESQHNKIVRLFGVDIPTD